MKIINTWLNENEYETFTKKAEKRGVTPYSLTKTLIQKYLEEEEQKSLGLSVVYWFLCYALIVATILQFI